MWRFCVLFCCGLILWPSQSSASCLGEISQSEHNALQALYDSTGGDYWIWSSKPDITRWVFPSSLAAPCTDGWQGMNCSKVSDGVCTVTDLELEIRNLTGTLPSEIAALSQLKKLKLNSNTITGTFPPEYGTMRALTEIDLSFNFLTGPIPSELGTLSLLTSFVLQTNNFTGTIPTLNLMSNLKILLLGENSLTGSIPAELYECYSLFTLGFDTNHLTGTLSTQISQFSSLGILDFLNNAFTGSIPSEIGSLSSILSLELITNYFTGSLPTEVGQLTSAISLMVSNNLLTGPLPSELGYLINITVLEVDMNHISSTLPSELCALTSLGSFLVSDNHLTGPIPSEIGQMTKLAILNIFSNSFTSSIPTEIGLLASLASVQGYDNLISGSLPVELYSCGALYDINMYTNYFSGSLSSRMGQLTALTFFSVEYAFITGTLPTEIGQLVLLQSFECSVNLMEGSIPSEMGLLGDVIVLSLDLNTFSGSLPSEIRGWRSLTYLYFYSCQITGTLPVELGELSALREVYLAENCFSGYIPWQMSNMSSLLILEISYNRLTGTFPSQLYQNPTISIIDFAQNFITGTISTEIGYLTQVTDYTNNNNYLSGTIPTEIGLWVDVMGVLLDANFFHGSIPSEFGALQKLLTLNISSNDLSEYVPSSLCNSSSIQLILVSSNRLKGSLPACLGNLKNLVQIDFSDNDFGNSLANMFPPLSFLSLQILDLSNNKLTGDIPSGMFQLPHIQSIVVDNNCFRGSLPASICLATNLTTLILDGLTSTDTCQIHSLDPILQGVFPMWYLSGGIPSCIWSMPMLSTLHLSGNGLTGNLGELSGSSLLRDVSVASNNLIGTIPHSWQRYGQFIRLDLSGNRLSGTLISDFNLTAEQQFVNMSVNRLSGNIPHSFISASGVNMLTGNMFQCQDGDLPQSDPEKNKYTCGSDGLNDSLLAWLCGFVLLAIPVISLTSSWKYCLFCNTGCLTSSSPYRENKSILHVLLELCLKLSVLFAITATFVYLMFKLGPWSGAYSTHTEQYGWVDSAAFVRGVFPAISVMSLVAMGSLITASVDNSSLIDSSSSSSSSIPTGDVTVSSGDFLHWAKIFSAHLFNMVVIMTVNVTYVYGTLQNLSEFDILAVQAGMAVFKVGWKAIAIPTLVRWSKSNYYHKIFMILVAFIGGPILSAFFSQSSCFLYVVIGEAPTTSQFTLPYFQCSVDTVETCLSVDCTTDIIDYCEFTPYQSLITASVSNGWMYSFQCSSALLMDYVPVFMFSYLLSGVVIPAMKLLSTYLLPSTLQDKFRDSIQAGSTTTLSKLLLNITILLTFGLADPLLTPAVALDSVMSVVMIKYLSSRSDLQERNADVESTLRSSILSPSTSITEPAVDGGIPIFDDTFAHRKQLTRQDLAAVVSVIAVFVGAFWSLFLLDMVGDQYGSIAGGGSMAVSVIGVPVVMWIGRNGKRSWFSSEPVLDPSIRESELVVSNPVRKPQDDNSYF